ncbi:MAG TPA: hypothetical protein VFS65_00225 [Candidatus Saccharimonadales bacterium]|nr:hypothetical protein [Candidatus Saccharimonadales bacterium]
MRQRTNQGGSMATYIIIGVILVLGLTIAAYTLKQRGEQVRKDQAISMSEDKKQSDADKAPVVEGDAPAADEAESSDKPGDSTADELPTTGPADTVGQLLGVGLLTMATLSYVSSRRSLSSSL